MLKGYMVRERLGTPGISGCTDAIRTAVFKLNAIDFLIQYFRLIGVEVRYSLNAVCFRSQTETLKCPEKIVISVKMFENIGYKLFCGEF